MRRPGLIVVLAKALIAIAAASWYSWLLLPEAPVGFLIGITPYLLLIVAWDFLGWPLVLPALFCISWLVIDAGLGFRHSRSSTAGVAIGMVSILACGVVGAAAMLRLMIPTKRNKRTK